jgi:hypothetical protein
MMQCVAFMSESENISIQKREEPWNSRFSSFLNNAWIAPQDLKLLQLGGSFTRDLYRCFENQGNYCHSFLEKGQIWGQSGTGMSKILFAIWMEDNFGCICRITVDGQVYKRTKLSLNSRSFKVLGRACMLLNSFWQRKSLHNVCPR